MMKRRIETEEILREEKRSKVGIFIKEMKSKKSEKNKD